MPSQYLADAHNVNENYKSDSLLYNEVDEVYNELECARGIALYKGHCYWSVKALPMKKNILFNCCPRV